MPTYKRPNQVTIDLGDLKQPWLALCEASGLTPSAAMRQMVQRVVSANTPGAQAAPRAPSSTPTGTPATPTPPGAFTIQPGRPERACLIQRVRLTPSEFAAAQAVADAERFSLPRWIASLVRSRLTDTAELGQDELQALGESNLRLLQIGRNLNQIAKALNAAPHEHRDLSPSVIEVLREDIKTHVLTVSNLIRANVKRWAITPVSSS